MSKQPEALKLASFIEEDRISSCGIRDCAKELRRLHAANVDLLTALKAAWKVIGPMSPKAILMAQSSAKAANEREQYATNDWVAAGCVIHEAIEKHGGTS